MALRADLHGFGAAVTGRQSLEFILRESGRGNRSKQKSDQNRAQG
jgi:hypothetical protein